MTDRMITTAIAALGATFTAVGLWAAVHAPSFGRTVADFGPRNDHLVHDYAAASLAVGLALLVAAYRTAWRVPVLTVAALWNGFHTVSHVVDHDEASSPALGTAVVVLLVGATVVLVALMRLPRAGRE